MPVKRLSLISRGNNWLCSLSHLQTVKQQQQNMYFCPPVIIYLIQGPRALWLMNTFIAITFFSARETKNLSSPLEWHFPPAQKRHLDVESQTHILIVGMRETARKRLAEGRARRCINLMLIQEGPACLFWRQDFVPSNAACKPWGQHSSRGVTHPVQLAQCEWSLKVLRLGFLLRAGLISGVDWVVLGFIQLVFG